MFNRSINGLQASTKILVTSFFWFLSFSIALAQTPTRDLNYYLTLGHDRSPLLKDLENQRKLARMDSLIIEAAAGPQLNATGAGLYAPVVHGIGYDEVISNGQSLEGYLQLNYALLNKKRVRNQLAIVKIASDSLRYAGKLSAYELERSIIDQYLTAYSSQQQRDFNQEVVTLLKQAEIILKQLTRTNIYKQSEYLAFLVTLQQQQLLTDQSDLQLQNDYATLAFLSGVEDTSRTILREPRLENRQQPFQSSFLIRKFDFDSLNNRVLKQSIDFNYKPKLGIYVNSGYSSSLTFQPYRNFGASAGFTLSLPIYDGKQRKMQYEKLAISARTISNYKNFFISQRAQQLNLISQQISSMESLFGRIREQIRFSKSLIEVDSKLLHTGDLRVADFIIAINNYMSAQNLFRQTTISKLRLINQFNYWNR